MPVYHLNIEVNKMGPEIEKKLSKFGKVIRGIEPLNLYFLDVEVPTGTTLEIVETYVKILSKIEKESYVTRVKEADEMEILSGNKIALDLGLKMTLEQTK